jgi:hypothetical protein
LRTTTGSANDNGVRLLLGSGIVPTIEWVGDELRVLRVLRHRRRNDRCEGALQLCCVAMFGILENLSRKLRHSLDEWVRLYIMNVCIDT